MDAAIGYDVAESPYGSPNAEKQQDTRAYMKSRRCHGQYIEYEMKP